MGMMDLHGMKANVERELGEGQAQVFRLQGALAAINQIIASETAPPIEPQPVVPQEPQTTEIQDAQ